MALIFMRVLTNLMVSSPATGITSSDPGPYRLTTIPNIKSNTASGTRSAPQANLLRDLKTRRVDSGFSQAIFSPHSAHEFPGVSMTWPQLIQGISPLRIALMISVAGRIRRRARAAHAIMAMKMANHTTPVAVSGGCNKDMRPPAKALMAAKTTVACNSVPLSSFHDLARSVLVTILNRDSIKDIPTGTWYV